MTDTRSFKLAFWLVAALATLGMGQTYDLSWNTIDGGGGMNSTGGGFSLSGTIGQPDASSFSTPMTGGGFTLVGGFWPVAGSACALIGDMNLDGLRDGADAQIFINCLLNTSGANCGCADFDGSGTATPADVSLFVSALLG